MEPGSITWIAKPSITNQAIGICIFDRVSQLQAAVETEEAEDLHEWVIQRYIERWEQWAVIVIDHGWCVETEEVEDLHAWIIQRYIER